MVKPNCSELLGGKPAKKMLECTRLPEYSGLGRNCFRLFTGNGYPNIIYVV